MPLNSLQREEGWTEVNSGGKVYYFNTKTQVTSWDPPPGGATAPRAPAVPARFAIGMAGGPPTGPPPMAPGGASAGLAPGWEAVTGPSGTYYFNKSTKETTWTKPSAGGPPSTPAMPSMPPPGGPPPVPPKPGPPPGGTFGPPPVPP